MVVRYRRRLYRRRGLRVAPLVRAKMARRKLGYQFARKRSFSRFGYRRPVKTVTSRKSAGFVLAAPSTGRYAGAKARTFDQMTYQRLSRLTITAAPAGDPDSIQAVVWSNTTFDILCGLDTQLAALAQAHEYFRVEYTGLEIKPNYNDVNPYTQIYSGSVQFSPVMKDSAYKFAKHATAVTPTYTPSTLSKISECVNGSTKPGLSFAGSNYRGKFQPGMSFRSQTDTVSWDDSNATGWTIPVKSEWTPTYITNNTGGSFSINPQMMWTPMALFADFGASGTNSFTFEIRVTYKFSFKERRLNTDSVFLSSQLGSSVRGDPHLRCSGVQSASRGSYEEKEEEEKKSSASASEVTNAGLVRQFTNIGLGSVMPPQVVRPPPGISVKRTVQGQIRPPSSPAME